MKSRSVLCGTIILGGFFAVFVACGSSDDAATNSPDGSIGSDASADGSSDGEGASDGRSSDDAAITDGGSRDATTRSDGGPCTPRPGGPMPCGASTCSNSTTNYCIYGAVPDVCHPLPVECQCEETFSCACLLANLDCDGGGGAIQCTAHDDAGLVEASDAATVNFFWVVAHSCTP